MIRRVENDNEHALALSCIKVLMGYDPDLGTPEGDELVDLARAVEEYENKRWPITGDQKR